MEPPTPKPNQAESAADAAFTAEQLDAFRAALKTLGIAPDQATPESIGNALTALKEHAATADSLAAKLEEVSAKLGSLEADAQARLAAELDAELEGYDLDDETRGVMKALPPEQRKPLLGKLPKKAAPEVKPDPAKAEPSGARQPAEGSPQGRDGGREQLPPPKPVHDPKGETKTAATDAARDAAVAKYQKDHPGVTFSAAWNAVRREQPELFPESTTAA